MRTTRRRQPTTREPQVTMIITTIGWPRCGTLSLCEQFVLQCTQSVRNGLNSRQTSFPNETALSAVGPACTPREPRACLGWVQSQEERSSQRQWNLIGVSERQGASACRWKSRSARLPCPRKRARRRRKRLPRMEARKL